MYELVAVKTNKKKGNSSNYSRRLPDRTMWLISLIHETSSVSTKRSRDGCGLEVVIALLAS